MKYLCLYLLAVSFIVSTNGQFDGIPNCPATPCYRSWFYQIRISTGQMPVCVQFHYIRTTASANYECYTSYSEKAVGIFTRGALRRPANEWTSRNINLCTLQTTYRAVLFWFPMDKAIWDGYMISNGLNPNYTSTDLSNPQGVGNKIWEIMYPQVVKDGMNCLGDYGVQYNRNNYTDYTGYVPQNPPSPLRLVHPNRWQPNKVEIKAECYVGGNRFYFRDQNFICPQAAIARTMLTPPSLIKSLYWEPPHTDYVVKTNQVIRRLAYINDYTKMNAEFFDQKLYSLGAMGTYAHSTKAPGDTAAAIQMNFVSNNMLFDSLSMAWREKRRFDEVRPFSAIHYLYDNWRIFTWAGPYQGSRWIKGNEWASYLTTDAHPEYPSGTACLCSVWAYTLRRFFGTDSLNYTQVFTKGSSFVEPGATPATTFSVNYPTFSSVEKICGLSRNWGGVHFLEAIEESWAGCPRIVETGFDNYLKLENGDLSWYDWADPYEEE